MAPKAPPYQHVPKKHATYLLAKIEHYEAEARETKNLANDLPLTAMYVLACVKGSLQHYAEQGK